VRERGGGREREEKREMKGGRIAENHR